MKGQVVWYEFVPYFKQALKYENMKFHVYYTQGILCNRHQVPRADSNPKKLYASIIGASVGTFGKYMVSDGVFMSD